MASVPHEPAPGVHGRQWSRLVVRETWVSLAIAVIWLSVAIDAIFGPDIVTSSVAGDTSTIPSAVILSGFAFLATWVVAHYGLRGHDGS